MLRITSEIRRGTAKKQEFWPAFRRKSGVAGRHDVKPARSPAPAARRKEQKDLAPEKPLFKGKRLASPGFKRYVFLMGLVELLKKCYIKTR
jgi:hypothetical protein